ncbi:MAG: metallophosphatase family protein [Ardenticatenaceae bacterium]|nr:metallophosphatase family protein [Ardenticatenaceae bacterium]
MRLAIIADIHGNLSALEAVLADIATQQIDHLVVAGDLVNRGPQSAAVLERLVPLRLPTIVGNHEDLLCRFIDGRVDPTWLDDPWWAATRFAARDVGPAWLTYMKSLPGQFVVEEEDVLPLRIVHGSPRHFMEGIGPITSPAALDEMLAETPEPFLICAHTHLSMIRQHKDTVIVNTGAVGLPFNDDPRAQYALLDWDRNEWKPTLRCVEYDRHETEAAYEQTGFLRAGGLSAWLLREELRAARPYLVPFWKFCTDRGLPLDESSLDLFLDEYAAGWQVYG